MYIIHIRCQIRCMDKIRNEEVKRRRGILKDLARPAVQCVMRWFRDTKIMEKDRLVKRIMKSDVKGATMRGWPRLEWMNIRKSLLTTGE